MSYLQMIIKLDCLFNIKGTTDPRDAVVTELQIADISDDVGTCWRELGPKLKISGSRIHNLDDEYRSNRDKANALLIIWKQQEGRGAIVGRLADTLAKIGRKSIAEKLLGGCTQCYDLLTSTCRCSAMFSNTLLTSYEEMNPLDLHFF